MQILESLQDHIPEAGTPQRIAIFSPETGKSSFSAVLVRVPAGHEFPSHVHPRSEDCFFALSGSGEVIEPGRSVHISAPACVWVPAGHPHGLAAGDVGMLELGVQAPPDAGSTSLDDSRRRSFAVPSVLAESLRSDFGSSANSAAWIPFFPARPDRRYLNPCHATLGASERLVAEAGEANLLVIVASGAVEISGDGNRRLRAMGAFHLEPHAVVELCALEKQTLLLAVWARGEAG